jgi:hypothetical protein
MTMKPETRVARVELYNDFPSPMRFTKYGSPVYTNGYLVALVVNGCRRHTIRSFGGNRDAARAFAAELNADPENL